MIFLFCIFISFLGPKFKLFGYLSPTTLLLFLNLFLIFGWWNCYIFVVIISEEVDFFFRAPVDSDGDRYTVTLEGMRLLGAMGVVCVGVAGDNV